MKKFLYVIIRQSVRNKRARLRTKKKTRMRRTGKMMLSRT